MMTQNLENLIKEEYLTALYEQQILENLSNTEIDTLFNEFISDVSEHFDFEIPEDSTIEDVLESFDDWDLNETESYTKLVEAIAKRPGAAKRKPAKPKRPMANKPKPAMNKPKPKPKAKPADKPQAKKIEVKPKAKKPTAEKPEGKKPEGPTKAEKEEKIASQKSALKDQIDSLNTKKEALQGKDDNKSREIETDIKKLDAERSKLTALQKKESGDEKAGDYNKLASLKKAEADAYAEWAKLKNGASESVTEAETEEIEAKTKEAKINFLNARIATLKQQEAMADSAEGKSKQKEAVANVEKELAALGDEPTEGEPTEEKEKSLKDIKKENAELNKQLNTAKTEKLKADNKVKEIKDQIANEQDPAKKTELNKQLNAASEEASLKGNEVSELEPKVDDSNEELEAAKEKSGGDDKAKKEKIEAAQAKIDDINSKLEAEEDPDKRAILKQKRKEAKAELAKLTGKEPEEDTESESDKMQDELINKKKIDAIQTKVDDLNDQLAAETDPAKRKLLKDKIKKEKAEIAKLKGEEPTDEEPSDDEKAADLAAENADKIDKLEAEIEKLEGDADAKVDAYEEAVQAQMQKTNKIVGWNLMLKRLATRMRMENMVEYNNAKIQLASPDLKDKLEDKDKELEKLVKQADEDLKKSEDENNKEHGDDPKVKDAQAKADTEDTGTETADDITKPATDSDIDSVEAKFAAQKKAREDADKAAQGKGRNADIEAKGDTPEEKVKDYSIKKMEKKISAISVAWQKMQDEASQAKGDKKESLTKKADAIEKNLNLAKEELSKLKSGSSTPNESFEDFESQIWAIDFILERVEKQMDEYQFLIVE